MRDWVAWLIAALVVVAVVLGLAGGALAPFAVGLGILAVLLWSLRTEITRAESRTYPARDDRIAPRPRSDRRSRRRAARFTGGARSAGRFDVAELGRRLGLAAGDLRAARPTYVRFTIPKRSGGQRVILSPDPTTKALQRRILRRVLARLPVHEACHGFERDRSIVTNAAPHAGKAILIRLDIEDFFGSTATQRVRRLYRVLGWDRDAARILTALTTYDGGLPQGAPTSPRLANLVNVRLDARLTGLARTVDASYTRYADDLTFSLASDDSAAARRIVNAAARILSQTGYRLHVGRKLRVRRRHERQLVTGLVVNASPQVPRTRRRWLRAVEHHLRTGRPATLDTRQLAGWHAFELMVATPPTGRSVDPGGSGPP